MTNIKATWEDEENNRQIQFSVEYQLENEAVEIKNVTPEKVSFICPDTNTVTKSVQVWTDKGRDMLASKLDIARIAQLKSCIAEREAANTSQELISIL